MSKTEWEKSSFQFNGLGAENLDMAFLCRASGPVVTTMSNNNKNCSLGTLDFSQAPQTFENTFIEGYLTCVHYI
jgi:hypothetical protein